MKGRLYAEKFGDPDDGTGDSQVVSGDSNASDYYLRLLAGGSLCDHFDENGQE